MVDRGSDNQTYAFHLSIPGNDGFYFWVVISGTSMGYDDPGPSSRTDPYLQTEVWPVAIVTIFHPYYLKSYHPQETQLLHQCLTLQVARISWDFSPLASKSSPG